MSQENLSDLPSYKEYELSEIDISLMSSTEVANWIFSIAQESGIDPKRALYCGIDSYSLRLNNSFSDRKETWAFTYEDVCKSTKLAFEVGTWTPESPFYYALNEEFPAVIIYDESKFDNLGQAHVAYDDKNLRSEREYCLKSGFNMDEAVIAVAYITH